MENIIDVILNGSIARLILLIVILILLIVYKTPVSVWSLGAFGKLKSTIFKRRQAREIKSLQYHQLFYTIETVRSSIKHQKFYCDKVLDTTKSQMFVDFMNFKLDAIRDAFQGLIEKAIRSQDNDHLKNHVMDVMHSTVTVYIRKTRMCFLEKGIPYDDADEIIELFERWRMDTISVIAQSINAIFASSYHKSKYANLLAVLEVISIAVALIPKDGVAAFNSVNGKFMKTPYKNR